MSTRRRDVAMFVIAFTLASVGGAACSGGGASASSGPTCKEFVGMSDADRQVAVKDWATAFDGRYQGDESAAGPALFQDYGSLMMWCQQPAHAEDRIMELAPAGG